MPVADGTGRSAGLCSAASPWIALMWIVSVWPNALARGDGRAARGANRCAREYRSIPAGGYRKPNLAGLFDEKTPPLVIRRHRGGITGPPIAQAGGSGGRPRRTGERKCRYRTVRSRHAAFAVSQAARRRSP